MRVKKQVLTNSEFRVEREGLRHIADMTAHLKITGSNLFAKEQRLATGGFQ